MINRAEGQWDSRCSGKHHSQAVKLPSQNHGLTDGCLWSTLKAIRAADILDILDFGLVWVAAYDWSEIHCLLVKSCQSQRVMDKV